MPAARHGTALLLEIGTRLPPRMMHVNVWAAAHLAECDLDLVCVSNAEGKEVVMCAVELRPALVTH